MQSDGGTARAKRPADAADAADAEPPAEPSAELPGEPPAPSGAAAAGPAPELLWEADEEYWRLRGEGRVPTPVGTLRSNPQQNGYLGPPFYFAEDHRGLGKSSCVVDDLTARGYFVLPGVKYGIDFVVYEGDPACHHGFFLLKVFREHESVDPLELIAWNRVAAQVCRGTQLVKMLRTKEANELFILENE